MQWISGTKAAEKLEVCRRILPRVALESGIRTRRLPGEAYPRYSAEDCDRVARESIIEPGQPERARAS